MVGAQLVGRWVEPCTGMSTTTDNIKDLLLLALSSSLFIGAGFIMQMKKGLKKAGASSIPAGMKVVIRLTLVMLVAALVPPAAFLKGEVVGAPVLQLENILHQKGLGSEILVQWDIARNGKGGLLDKDIGFVQFPVLAGFIDRYTGWPYLTHLKLGNPQKSFTLLVDTGSDTMWVSCTPYSGCPTNGIRKSYDIGQSQTSSVIACSDNWCQTSIRGGFAACDSSNHENGHCSYRLVYGNGGTTVGYYVSDKVHLETIGGNTTSFSSAIVFGCSNSQSGSLIDTNLAFDGILGIGPNQESFTSQVNSAGLAPMAFSLCMNSSGIGVLVLGEAIEPGLVYTPLEPSKYLYVVHLESIAVNGQKLPIETSVFTSHDRQTFVDSGTALAYLPDEAYNGFLTAISTAVSLSPFVSPVVNNGEHCFICSSSLSLDLSFPTVTLHFAGGAEMIAMPRNYLLLQASLDNHQSLFCIGWKRSMGKPRTIIGDIVLMDKLIVHDFENMRLGWVNYNCSQPIHTTTSNHWNKTSNRWNKRKENSGHKSYNVLIPTGIAIMLTFIMILGL